jgi:hypothetical protein
MEEELLTICTTVEYTMVVSEATVFLFTWNSAAYTIVYLANENASGSGLTLWSSWSHLVQVYTVSIC